MAWRIPWQRFFPTGSGLGDETEDFLAGPTPLDLTFDRAGNLYVADYTGEITRVAKL